MHILWYLLGALAILAVGLVILAIVSRRRFMRFLVRPFLEVFYRKEIHGLENLPATGGCVIISNHVSWIDGVLLLWLLPRNIRFVVDGRNFNSKIGEWVAGAFDTILMLSGPKSILRALKTARQGVIDGDVIGIFPEGTITRTGQLQAFRPGITKILKGTDAVVIPIWVEGMWGSMLSFSGGKFFFKWPTNFRRKLKCHIGPPIPGGTSIEMMRSHLQDMCAQASIENRREFPLLASRVIRAWKKAARGIQAADSLGTELTGRQILIRTLALRRALRREVFTDDERFVGLLLPPSVGAVCVNVALAMDRRVSANLNYTVSSQVLNHCIAEVGIKHVLTSKKFMEKINLDLDADVVLLDDLKDKVSAVDKAVALVTAYLPASWIDRLLGLNRVDRDDLLTVIFTSGSTGMPKGVLLSNANVSHNVDAIDRAVRLTREDSVMGILPFFHSFGYSVTLWAAQTLGPRGVYHFNPLDARQVGKLCEKYHATVLLGTPTFLRGYLRRIDQSQFADMNVVVVGAEKMPHDLFDAFEEKFGVRPVEGYGATELSPLVSVNIPPSRSVAKYQPDLVEGSVGRPLSGISVRIVSPDTEQELEADEDGMLLVSGPNVMKGYANRNDLTVEAIHDGWYVTGDIARVDKEGFLHITGRLSRFSKIGGEMVPHGRIEEELAKRLAVNKDDEAVRVFVTGVPDAKKGERLIVLYKTPNQDERDAGATDVSIDELREGLKQAGLPNLFIPAADAFYVVDEIPLLGTGKLDLKQAKDKALELSGQGTPQ